MNYENFYPLSKVSPGDTKIELNSRAAKCVLVYFEEKYGREELKKFVYSTKMNLEYLENGHNWISFEYFCRLLARLVEYTKDPASPFTAGTYTCRRDCYGALATIASRLGTPLSMYKLTVDVAPRYVKCDNFEISDLRRNGCTIKLHMHEGFSQDKNNCLNLQGIFSSIPLIWKLPMAKVKETECAAGGGKTCTYHIHWVNKPYCKCGLVGLLTGVIAIFAVWKFFGIIPNIFYSILVITIGYLAGRIRDCNRAINDTKEINERESYHLMESIETIEKLNMELQAKVEQRTSELDASNIKLQKILEELKDSQDRLVQSEKMASVGQLAAGMAHELNNPVGAIRNYIQDILEDIAPGDPTRERLLKAEKATSRCNRIVGDLLSFAIGTGDIADVDVNKLLDATISRARQEMLSPKISVITKFGKEFPVIRADQGQLRQVFTNILSNSNDAIGDADGEIYVKTHQNAECVFIEISDTGKGIENDIKNKIFDPFFSTKIPGKGMGLGLAISYNIIKRFGGELSLKSTSSAGTTFIISFPKKSPQANG